MGQITSTKIREVTFERRSSFGTQLEMDDLHLCRPRMQASFDTTASAKNVILREGQMCRCILAEASSRTGLTHENIKHGTCPGPAVQLYMYSCTHSECRSWRGQSFRRPYHICRRYASVEDSLNLSLLELGPVVSLSGGSARSRRTGVRKKRDCSLGFESRGRLITCVANVFLRLPA